MAFASGDWVLVHWLDSISDECAVHPDDLALLRKTLPYNATAPSQTMGLVTGLSGEYVVVDYVGRSFRILPDKTILMLIKYQGQFQTGDRVTIKSSGIIGKIKFVTWHHVKEQPFFTIEDETGVRSNRYYESDITLLSDS